ncbi:hypothetical protein Tco_0963839 [Tanacetum coccineum]
MVAFLEKSTGSAEFHQIIDFITRSHICYALTKKPEVCVSFIKQFWRSAEALTDGNGDVKINATIDGHSLSITEGSLRRHLKLDDQDGITSLPTTEIFAQLALMGYTTDSDKLTFQKGAFSPQWRFLIHNILHCLSPKKTAWEQFSSNIAAAVICLATNRKFNFSRMIFEHMVSNISSPHKFLMYPRFIQLCLDMQRHKLQQHTRFYSVPSLTMKVFSNMKRSTKGFSGQAVALFPTMLDDTEPSPSPSRITSSPSPTPSPSPEPSPTQPSPTQPTPTQPSPTQLSPTQPGTEYHLPTPHDSPLHAVHSHGSDEGSLKLQELMNLVTTLSDRIGVLEADLLKTKKTYSSAYTKLILRVKKLESQIKIGKARKQTRVVISDDEAFEDDSSKQGRKSAEALTDGNGDVKINATIDGHSLSITEGSLRRHLKLDDQDGITSLPTTEIFEQLALMGYTTDSDKLTFQKGAFSPQWRFLIHNILHCLSPKKTAWEQFSSNIAAAVICLATNRKFNFSRMIFDHMVSNISSPHKFLMYPRFIQLCLDMQRHKLQQHTRFYSVPSLTMKVFSNMKRSTKGFLGQEVALFPTMLDATEPSPSPSRITSSPSPTPSPSPAPSPLQPSPTQPSPT